VKKNPLAAIEPRPPFEAEIAHRGVVHRIAAEPYGDVYFAILYPDVESARKDCSHFATLNGRTVDGKIRAYPLEIYGDVLAIMATYQTPEGFEPLDMSSVFALYDKDPGLFAQLRGLALIGVGVVESTPVNSGRAAWSDQLVGAKQLERALRDGEDEKARALAKALRQRAAVAMRDFDVSAPVEDEADDPRDVDPTMEAVVGNSPAGP
jgi:hypothetical protein